jgi:L-threonate 2-dehydrogenase
MARRSKGNVGVVGLGTMGGAYARHLAAAGWRVTGYDIASSRRRAAARVGVAIAKDAAALARASPVIITSLPSADALDTTIAAITRERLAPRTIVEASTLMLADKERAEKALREAGHMMLDCPVSGTGAQAAVKDIVIYASGEARAIARVRRIFSAFSRASYDLGRFGNGSRMKYVANLLVTIHNVASAEAIVLGIKSGLDPKVIYDVIRAGAGTSRVFELRGPMMVRDAYEPATMSVNLYHKDIAVIEDHAARLGVPTPLFSASIPLYSSALALGYGEQDTASVCAALQRMAGVKRGTRKRRRARHQAMP